MKRTILVLLLLAGLVVVPAMAQDFSSPKPQFLSFNFGVPLGYSLAAEDFVAGRNFGINITVVENLEIGFDHLGIVGLGFGNAISSYNFLRLAFSFTDMFGAAIGYGGASSASALTVGFFANFFQDRAANGLAYGLGLRIDYLAHTDAFADGSILLAFRATFGL